MSRATSTISVGLQPGHEDDRIVEDVLVILVPVGDAVRRVDQHADVLGAARAEHLGQAQLSGHGQALLAARAHPAEELVGDLAHRVVEDRADDALAHHQLHGASARSHGVEHDDLVAAGGEQVEGQQGAAGEDAEVRHPDEGLAPLLRGQGHLDLGHAVRGARRVGQDLAQERIEADDVGHAEHHGDVHDVDVGRGVARGDRRHHDLRQAIGQGAHHLGADRGSLQAAEADHAVQGAGLQAVPEDPGGALGHDGLGRLPAGVAQEVAERRPAGEGDLFPRRRPRGAMAFPSLPGRPAGPGCPASRAARAGTRLARPLVSRVARTAMTLGMGSLSPWSRNAGRRSAPRSPRRPSRSGSAPWTIRSRSRGRWCGRACTGPPPASPSPRRARRG